MLHDDVDVCTENKTRKTRKRKITEATTKREENMNETLETLYIRICQTRRV
jgi:hypothetical protein